MGGALTPFSALESCSVGGVLSVGFSVSVVFSSMLAVFVICGVSDSVVFSMDWFVVPDGCLS